MTELMAVFQRDDTTKAVTIAESARRVVSEALERSALIGKVTTPDENECASRSQGELSAIIRQIDKAKLEATKPLRDFVDSINAAAKGLSAELRDESIRLARLTGDYIAAEQAKARAVESARIADLTLLERERNAEIAKAQSLDEIEAIKQQASIRAAEIQAQALKDAPVRAAGQVAKPDWDIEVTNPMALAMRYPHCVDIKPKVSEIKALLSAGVSVETFASCGVTAKSIVRTSVRSAATKYLEA